MISIYMIIATLLPMALPKGSMECNLCGPTGTLLCLGALREPMFFHLPKNVKKTMLKKNERDIILNTANSVGILNKEYNNRSTYFSNGTFKLNNARRTDSGNYQLQTFGSDGKLLHDINMHLEIQARVSKPAVSQMCLSPKRMNVSCSSEGDGVEFILTLDGHLLMQSPSTQHSVSNITIGLHGQLTGNLMCNVRNNVSREETVIHLTSCQGSVSHSSLVAVVVIASVTTLLLHLALFLGIKHFNKKARPITAKEENAEDEIVYSDVRVMKHTRKTRPNTHQNAT